MALLLNSNPNDKPQSSKLDDLIKHAIESANDFNTEYEWTGSGHEDMALSVARAQILALLEEVIGPMNGFTAMDDLHPDAYKAQKRLKTEQYQRKDAL